MKHSCPSPEGGVDLQGFAQHLGSYVVHVVPAQVHLPQTGVATQGVDQDGPPGAQPRVRQGQRLQGLGEGRTPGKAKKRRTRFPPKMRKYLASNPSRVWSIKSTA